MRPTPTTRPPGLRPCRAAVVGRRPAAHRRALGFTEELERLPKAFPAIFAVDLDSVAAGGFAEPVREGGGEVVLLLEFGYVPIKEQRDLNVPILKSDRRDDQVAWARDVCGRMHPEYTADQQSIEYWLRVAVPVMVGGRPVMTGARVSVADAGVEGRALPIEDIEGRSLATFRAKEGAIYLKTIIRALAKYSAQEAVDRRNEVAGTIANLLGAIMERADTRGWITLPNRIAMARLVLPPGRWDLRVELTDDRGEVVESLDIRDVEVRGRDRVFFSARVY